MNRDAREGSEGCVGGEGVCREGSRLRVKYEAVRRRVKGKNECVGVGVGLDVELFG